MDEANAIIDKANQIDESFELVINLIFNKPQNSRLVTTGVGKSGFIAKKFAATLSSTGTPSFYLNPLDALHGDLGVVHKNDIIFGISQSGQSDELCKIFDVLSLNKKISLTGNKESKLSLISDLHILNKIKKEACYLNLAPTTSTTLALAICDSISICLMKLRGFDKEKFSSTHPLGSLGRRLTSKVSDVMVKDIEQIPIISSAKSVSESIIAISKYGMGFIIIANDKNFPVGIFTDGDLRRILDSNNIEVIFNDKISNYMNKNFIMIKPFSLIVDCLNIMKKNKITSIPVVNESNVIVGAINIRQIINYQI